MFAVSATRTNQAATRIISERLRKQRSEREAEMKRREEVELEAKRREMEKREAEAQRAEQFQNYVNIIASYREVDLTGADKLSVKDIIIGAVQGTGINYDDVLSHRRTRAIVDLRHYAILCVWSLRPDMSLPNIGKHTGGRDHSSIHHAINRFGFKSREESAAFIRAFGRETTMARIAKQAA
ncbi:hypothetical protein KUG47_12030 [Falsochrobactrum sp. TDYN1]|uniref:Chromosomal replication initiator DnaA C-terminal domain-containing protein n=2 Tax=Falsochrobactrum tianjinense TaxID=2706015 RepID=A0A949UUW1_9HYPH|nr:hypothetical protein [Falsochrobactrum sp. TDYN1]